MGRYRTSSSQAEFSGRGRRTSGGGGDIAAVVILAIAALISGLYLSLKEMRK